jgi:hypothetical protein
VSRTALGDVKCSRCEVSGYPPADSACLDLIAAARTVAHVLLRVFDQAEPQRDVSARRHTLGLVDHRTLSLGERGVSLHLLDLGRGPFPATASPSCS